MYSYNLPFTFKILIVKGKIERKDLLTFILSQQFMSLEQLLPGGLYKTVVEQNKEIKRNSDNSLVKFLDNAVDKIQAGSFEFARDLAYLAGPAVILTDNKPAVKALGVVAFSAYYAGVTYFIPLVFKGRNYVIKRWLSD